MPDFNLECPICKFKVKNDKGLASHFRHQSETHPDYREWKSSQKWVGKTEPRDYVTCMECSHRAASLTGHIRVHKLSAEEYRGKYGLDTLLKSTGTRTKRIDSIKRARSSGNYDGLKNSICTECGKEHKIHKLSQPMRCDVCMGKEEDQKWVGKSEPEDYVTCLECGYRAESLVSHISSQHPRYREDHPNAIIVALDSAIRDKSHLQGVSLSEETKNKMSENAGRWNKGLSAETDERVSQMRDSIRRGFQEGRESWSKGLTMEDSTSLQSTSRSLREWNQNNERHWSKCDYSVEDFKPYLYEDGVLNRGLASYHLEVSTNTITHWAEKLGIPYATRAESLSRTNTVRLDREVFEPFLDENDLLDIPECSRSLGLSYRIIKREMERYGIQPLKKRWSQYWCLETIAEILGSSYKQEWGRKEFLNTKTGFRYRFDGYFPEFGIVVEFHGYQHYTYPNIFHKTEEEYKEQKRRDLEKKNYILGEGSLHYLCIKELEPFRDASYIRGRLFEIIGEELFA